MTIDTLLIDGDMLVHRSCVAVEKDTRFLDRWHILFSDAEDAWGVLMETLGELGNIAGTENYIFCFSDPERRNWRYTMVDDDYKSERAGQRKPLAYWSVIDKIDEYFKDQMEWKAGLEGDDILGLLQTDPNRSRYGTTAIWSLDKDLRQIPGFHIRDDEIIDITLEEANEFHMFQTLAGDPVDGYTGCPGMGKERSLSALQSMKKVVPYRHTLQAGKRKGEVETRYKEVPAKGLWEIVVSHYEKAGLGEYDALLNARLARILRHDDYVNGEVKLWNP